MSRLSEILERRAERRFPNEAITQKVRVAIDVYEYEGARQAAGRIAREIYEDFIKPQLNDIDWLLSEHARLRGQRDALRTALEEVIERIDGYVDVKDSDSGVPAANDAMRATQIAEAALKLAKDAQ